MKINEEFHENLLIKWGFSIQKRTPLLLFENSRNVWRMFSVIIACFLLDIILVGDIAGKLKFCIFLSELKLVFILSCIQSYYSSGSISLHLIVELTLKYLNTDLKLWFCWTCIILTHEHSHIHLHKWDLCIVFFYSSSEKTLIQLKKWRKLI